MPAPEGNTYAVKPTSEKRSVRLMPSFTPPEKRELMKHHKGRGSLAEHVGRMALVAIRAGLDIEGQATE